MHESMPKVFMCMRSRIHSCSAIIEHCLKQQPGWTTGVLNVVSGDASDIGTELATNTAVRKLTFTGSTRVGKLLMKQAADTVKRLSMELGGNAPYIVFKDADIGKAADAAVASGLRNAGQTCICANRILVEVLVLAHFPCLRGLGN